MMSVLNRAFRNSRRMIGRSLLMGCILFVISALVMVGMSIESSSQKSIQEARNNLGNTVVLQRNISGNMRNFDPTAERPEIKELTIEEAEKYASIKYVQGYNYSNFNQSSASINAIQPDGVTATPTVTPTPSATAEATITPQITPTPSVTQNYPQDRPNFDIMRPEDQDFQLSGNRLLQLSTDFFTGTKTLIDGDFYTVEDNDNKAKVVIINEDLAELNNMKVGDKFTLTSSYLTDDPGMEVEIIGIYHDKNQPDLSVNSASRISSNTLYLPYNTVKEYSDKVSEARQAQLDELIEQNGSEFEGRRIQGMMGSNLTVTYYINDPDNIEKFKNEAIASGLDTESFTMEGNDTQFQQLVGPLEKLANFAKAMVIAVIATGALVMILLMSMITRERKGEVGILRALGQKRGSIGAQFAAEAFMVCIVALILGTLVGASLSNYTANKLLSNQVESVQAAQTASPDTQNGFQQMGPGDFGGRGGAFIFGGKQQVQSTLDPISTITTNIGLMEVLKVMGAGLLISFIGSMASTYWVMKYEPMQILSNRT